ncbi:MAG: phospholipid carrier-dependent glycosyltransferase [Planctomycetota bacterium]|nr:MAG: phospholipid carrier-dependent glycosyltransferase [Planctomycetota bacterium]REJ96134.1 MAG: phospholipid carrier-dependent glycosyltransferase [Planctomycetota bacterium]REK22741.1 MAG: phospholipid carrier-dependent glycosyltransferase [Planctomycetota bacterium]REK33839.1 MAG: phospholipid carrier-dependent glycosyltransferase [Planctomycetota bacterium]
MAGRGRVLTGAESPRRRYALLASIVLLGFAVRVVAVSLWQENLVQDRDAYLALAAGLLEGRGLSSPGTTRPTAFRPPLYPMLLAARGGADALAYVAIVHVLLGTATVALTLLLARRLGLGTRAAALAAGIVGLDPLLVLYTTFPMTETLSTFLTTALLLWIVHFAQAQGPPRRTSLLFAGVLFGLNVLCRPTLWVFGLLILLHGTIRVVRRLPRQPSQSAESAEFRGRLFRAWPAMAGVLICVLPWTARNWNSLGAPIVTTTHGGYTLLLGNNPAFYQEVVAQPVGTVWDGSRGPGQSAWMESINHEMDRMGLESEIARDRWMSRRARRNIASDPIMFSRASLLRLLRFWNVVPSGGAADGVPQFLRWAIGAFYAVVLLSAAGGLVRWLRLRDARLTPLVLLIASFTLVHLFYWSNVRMRAPVMPAVAVLAASLIGRCTGLRSIARRHETR